MIYIEYKYVLVMFRSLCSHVVKGQISAIDKRLLYNSLARFLVSDDVLKQVSFLKIYRPHSIKACYLKERSLYLCCYIR